MKDQTIDINKTPTGVNKQFENSLCLVYVQTAQRKTLEKTLPLRLLKSEAVNIYTDY